MSTLREHYNEEELEAARVLDRRRAGLPVPDAAVVWALRVLGDGVGCSPWASPSLEFFPNNECPA